jgi:hypothetical protein
MIKIQITNNGGRKAKALEARKREYTLKVVANLKVEFEANPELLGTVYQSEEEVAFEVMGRVKSLMEMEKQADKMRGGLLGDLRYKLAKK